MADDNLAQRVSVLDQGERGERSPALLEAVRVLRERWWLVLGAFVVCLGVTLALSLSQTKQYRATSTVYVKVSSLTTLIDPTQAQTQEDPARVQGDNLTLVRSLAVANRVRTELGLRETLDDLLANLDASAVPDTDLINISYTDPSPSRAARVANAFGDQLVGYLAATVQQQIAQGQAAITSQLSQLGPTDPTRALLQQALSRIVALRAASSGNALVVDRAEVPHSASSPRTKRDVIIGALVGIVLGLALAFLVDLLDRRVKDVEELERLYGRAPLTAIALRRSLPAAERDQQFQLEPFRTLRDSLDFVSLRSRVQVAVVTSAVPGEGKTTVAIGLARAAAFGGRRVVLVEADLHRPTITRQLDLDPFPRGLTNVLSGSVTVAEAVRPAPQDATLSVLTSGPLATHAAERLRSRALDELLEELRREYDLIVMDTPPLLNVSDAQVLIDNPLVDVVLMVARPYVVTREQVRTARAVLERHPEANVGLVINGVRRAGGYYYYGAGGDGEALEAADEAPSRRLMRRKEKVGS